MKRLSPILTKTERTEFDFLDNTVQKTKECAWEFGAALAKIKAGALWREDYSTWENYCSQRAGCTSARVRQMILAIKVKELAERNGQPVPQNERQARRHNETENEPEMTADNLPDIHQDNLTEPTTINVTTVTVTPEPPGVKPNGEFKQSSLPKEFRDAAGLDEMGYPIPEKVIENFRKREELLKLVEVILGVKQHVLNAIKAQEKTFWRLTSTWTHEADSLAHGLKAIAPYAVCPFCQGRTFENCLSCGKTGVVGKFYYEHNVPEELRRLREIQINKLKNGAPA